MSNYFPPFFSLSFSPQTKGACLNKRSPIGKGALAPLFSSDVATDHCTNISLNQHVPYWSRKVANHRPNRY